MHQVGVKTLAPGILLSSTTLDPPLLLFTTIVRGRGALEEEELTPKYNLSLHF